MKRCWFIISNLNFEEKEEGVIIHGNPDFRFESDKFKSLHDHRMAMASAVLALKRESVSTIKGAGLAAVFCVEFWEDLESIFIWSIYLTILLFLPFIALSCDGL